MPNKKKHTSSVGSSHPDRSQLQQIITGLSEGIVIVEPDRTITYANQAALAMHGARTLDELGRTTSSYLSQFVFRSRTKQVLRKGKSPIERAMAGEEFPGAIVEVSRRERPQTDWTHCVRSLVVRTSNTSPECHVLIIADITGEVEAEDRFHRMFNANPAPALICRLSDLRYIAINDGFLQLTGFLRDDVLGHSVYEIDVLEKAEQRDLAIQRLKKGAVIPQMEACLRLPQGHQRYVIVAGQPIEYGTEPCMLFTFADLEDRRKAELALERSEERFVKAFRLSPVPTMVGTIEDHRLVDVNEAFVKTMGYTPEETIGRNTDDLQLWVDLETRQKFIETFSSTGHVRNLDAKMRTKNGEEIDCLVSAEVLTINEKPCVLYVFQDITERKRSEADLISAIEAAMTDSTWFSRGLIDKLTAFRQRSTGSAPKAVLPELTAREKQIVRMICDGDRDAKISTALKLSPNTVRNHVAALYRKLGVNSRSQVMIWARERGLEASSARESANVLR